LIFAIMCMCACDNEYCNSVPSFDHLKELRQRNGDKFFGKLGQPQKEIFEHNSSSFDSFCHSSSSSQDTLPGPRWADMSDSENDEGGKTSIPRGKPSPHAKQVVHHAAVERQAQPKGRGRGKTGVCPQPDKGDAIASQGRSRNSRHKGGAGNKQQARGHDTKHQCQFFIGIEEELKFRVVRRIIGTAGANVKYIADQSGPDTKLRLRGRGSKFFEGPEQQEAPEPLMLCVSVPNRGAYETVTRLVREQLERVYDEYDVFRVSNGQNAAKLRVRMHEGPRAGSR